MACTHITPDYQQYLVLVGRSSFVIVDIKLTFPHFTVLNLNDEWMLSRMGLRAPRHALPRLNLNLTGQWNWAGLHCFGQALVPLDCAVASGLSGPPVSYIYQLQLPRSKFSWGCHADGHSDSQAWRTC